jgi:disulfide bond formation protein DsbB
MAIRSIRLVGYLVALLALGTGVSLAASGPAKVAAANPAPVAFCATDPSFAHRRIIYTSIHDRIALHCHCCGTDENGHCNHQCCD